MLKVPARRCGSENVAAESERGVHRCQEGSPSVPSIFFASPLLALFLLLARALASIRAAARRSSGELYLSGPEGSPRGKRLVTSKKINKRTRKSKKKKKERKKEKRRPRKINRWPGRKGRNERLLHAEGYNERGRRRGQEKKRGGRERERESWGAHALALVRQAGAGGGGFPWSSDAEGRDGGVCHRAVHRQR